MYTNVAVKSMMHKKVVAEDSGYIIRNAPSQRFESVCAPRFLLDLWCYRSFFVRFHL
jgi:hypothetical protein